MRQIVPCVGGAVYALADGINATQAAESEHTRMGSDIEMQVLHRYFPTAVILIIALYFSIKTSAVDELAPSATCTSWPSWLLSHPVSGNHAATYQPMISKGVGHCHLARRIEADS